MYTRTSAGLIERSYTFETKDWQGIDESLTEVLHKGARVAVLAGKDREFIIGDVVVYLRPLRDEAFALILERKKATLDWKERFNNAIDAISNTEEDSRESHFDSEFHRFFLWIRETLPESPRVIHAPKALPSLEERKLVLIGLSKAGKTSIVKKFFEGETIEKALDTRPTVLRTISRHFLPFLSGNIITHDFGGQEEFIAQHLFDKSAFRKLLALLFVFDVQDEDRFPQALKYFTLTLERVRETNEIGFISVFLHKYDPKLRSQLLDRLTEMIGKILDAASGFPLVFHPTTIFDESLSHAIVRTLFYALPGSVLEQALTREKLLLIHTKLRGSENPEQLAWEEGLKIAEDVLEKWVDWASGSIDQATEGESAFHFSFQEGKIQFRLQCPIPEGLKSPQCCDLTSRILGGICQAVGIDPPAPNPELKESKNGFCYFVAVK
ncbi:MAG: ADP-ribosylation factor-like protein [Candidatus Thorarchaeota archaeon]